MQVPIVSPFLELTKHILKHSSRFKEERIITLTI